MLTNMRSSPIASAEMQRGDNGSLTGFPAAHLTQLDSFLTANPRSSVETRNNPSPARMVGSHKGDREISSSPAPSPSQRQFSPTNLDRGMPVIRPSPGGFSADEISRGSEQHELAFANRTGDADQEGRDLRLELEKSRANEAAATRHLEMLEDEINVLRVELVAIKDDASRHQNEYQQLLQWCTLMEEERDDAVVRLEQVLETLRSEQQASLNQQLSLEAASTTSQELRAQIDKLQHDREEQAKRADEMQLQLDASTSLLIDARQKEIGLRADIRKEILGRKTQRSDMEKLEREVGEQKLIINMLRSGLESAMEINAALDPKSLKLSSLSKESCEGTKKCGGTSKETIDAASLSRASLSPSVIRIPLAVTTSPYSPHKNVEEVKMTTEKQAEVITFKKKPLDKYLDQMRSVPPAATPKAGSTPPMPSFPLSPFPPAQQPVNNPSKSDSCGTQFKTATKLTTSPRSASASAQMPPAWSTPSSDTGTARSVQSKSQESTACGPESPQPTPRLPASSVPLRTVERIPLSHAVVHSITQNSRIATEVVNVDGYSNSPSRYSPHSCGNAASGPPSGSYVSLRESVNPPLRDSGEQRCIPAPYSAQIISGIVQEPKLSSTTAGLGETRTKDARETSSWRDTAGNHPDCLLSNLGSSSSHAEKRLQNKNIVSVSLPIACSPISASEMQDDGNDVRPTFPVSKQVEAVDGDIMESRHTVTRSVRLDTLTCLQPQWTSISSYGSTSEWNQRNQSFDHFDNQNCTPSLPQDATTLTNGIITPLWQRDRTHANHYRHLGHQYVQGSQGQSDLSPVSSHHIMADGGAARNVMTTRPVDPASGWEVLKKDLFPAHAATAYQVGGEQQIAQNSSVFEKEQGAANAREFARIFGWSGAGGSRLPEASARHGQATMPETGIRQGQATLQQNAHEMRTYSGMDYRAYGLGSTQDYHTGMGGMGSRGGMGARAPQAHQGRAQSDYTGYSSYAVFT